MTVEELAIVLHEAGREAVEKNLIVRADLPSKGFIEWADLSEEAREGRRVQTRFLLARFDISGKTLAGPKTTGPDFSGLVPGRMVHFVAESGEHRAAVIVQAPGTIYRRNFNGNPERAPQNLIDLGAGVVDLAVFSTPTDFNSREREMGMTAPLVLISAALYDPDAAPGTWHWIKGAEQRQRANATDSPA